MTRAIVVAAVVVGWVVAASAEKVDMAPAQLREAATHVVVGKVTAIYERRSLEDKWSYTRRVAEVLVEKAEKGESVKAGDLVYARYWTREWRGGDTTPPSTAGHRGLPKEGETLRLYLARNAYDGFRTDNADGGFNVIGANGFERIAPEPPKGG